MTGTIAIDAQRTEMLERMLGNDKETYCDLTLRCVESGTRKCVFEFAVNRSFLGSSSAVWLAAFFGHFSERNADAVIELIDVKPAALRHVIRHAYFLKPQFGSEEAFDVRVLAERYQVSGLVPVCDEIVAGNCTPQSACQLLTAAESHNLPSLICKCIAAIAKFSRRQCKQLLDSESFLQMSVGSMRHLLSSDKLNVREEAVFEKLLQWSQHLQRETETVLSPLAAVKKHIHFGAMDARFVVTTVADSKLLDASEELCVLRAQVLGAQTAAQCPFKTRRRKGLAFFEDTSVVARGAVRGSGVWNYRGRADELCFAVDKHCALFGVGLLCGEGLTEATLTVFKDRSKSQALYSQTAAGITHGKVPEPFALQFEAALELEPGQVYSLELAQRNADGNSFRTAECSSTVTVDGCTVTFSAAQNSANGTCVRYGAFPSLFLWIP